MNQHAPFLHPYDGMIPLPVAGYVLGAVLLLVHLYALVKRQQVQAFLLASPRNHLLAQVLLAIGLFWFFLLVAPEGLGVLSYFRVGLAEFEGIRWLLQLACPVFLVLMVTHYVSLASMVAGCSFPIFTLISPKVNHLVPFVVFSFIIAILLIYTHRKNIERLKAGTESKIYIWKPRHVKVDPEEAKDKGANK